MRFEDTDRWLRGRVVASLVAGESPPAAEPRRMERILAGLERDGLVVRDASGAPSLPGRAAAVMESARCHILRPL